MDFPSRVCLLVRPAERAFKETYASAGQRELTRAAMDRTSAAAPRHPAAPRLPLNLPLSTNESHSLTIYTAEHGAGQRPARVERVGLEPTAD